METERQPATAPGQRDHHRRSLRGRLRHAWRSLPTSRRRLLRNLLIALLISLMAVSVALLMVQFQ